MGEELKRQIVEKLKIKKEKRVDWGMVSMVLLMAFVINVAFLSIGYYLFTAGEAISLGTPIILGGYTFILLVISNLIIFAASIIKIKKNKLSNALIITAINTLIILIISGPLFFFVLDLKETTGLAGFLRGAISQFNIKDLLLSIFVFPMYMGWGLLNIYEESRLGFLILLLAIPIGIPGIWLIYKNKK